MRIPKVAVLFLLAICLVLYLTYTKRNHDNKSPATFLRHPLPLPAVPVVSGPKEVPVVSGPKEAPTPTAAEEGVSHRYGIMFDAGSTGTRIHVFKFLMQPNEPPKLAHESFKAIKPGLSAYADDPDRCAEGIHQLLEVAESDVPREVWATTPLVLKATAGLRLLPGEKATHLLNKVKELFSASPFLSSGDSVAIMDGTDEGMSAWITINFLTGSLHAADIPTVGMLDLGGGSTQITFSPRDEKTVQTSPDDITSFQMFNLTHTLYSHSYLGLGLMSARLAVLGGTEGEPLLPGQELLSPCLAPNYRGTWEHAEVKYALKGQKGPSYDGKRPEPMYEPCRIKVEKMLYKRVKKAEDLFNMEFYAFSYYYDRAVDLKLIDEKSGGSVTVGDYIVGAKKVCNNMTANSGDNPFLCLDLVYISVLLQELGFSTDKQFMLSRTIDGVETSWALGATFHHLQTLHSL